MEWDDQTEEIMSTLPDGWHLSGKCPKCGGGFELALREPESLRGAFGEVRSMCSGKCGHMKLIKVGDLWTFSAGEHAWTLRSTDLERLNVPLRWNEEPPTGFDELPAPPRPESESSEDDHDEE